MNVKTKHRLLELATLLSKIRLELDDMKNEQIDDFDEMLEVQQEGEVGLKQRDVIYSLECALSAIEEVIDYIGEAQC